MYDESKLTIEQLKCCGNCEFIDHSGYHCRKHRKEIAPWFKCPEWYWDHTEIRPDPTA